MRTGVIVMQVPFLALFGVTWVIAGVGLVVMRHALADRRWQAVVVAVMALAVARDTVRFVVQVDVPGTVHKAFNSQEADAAEGRLPDGLSFMRWSRGPSHYQPDEMTALVRYLRDADGDFLLIGDSTILYGLTGRLSLMRPLWFDPALTLPRAEAPEFAAFEADLIARLRGAGVRRIVLEGPKTWGGVTLGDFPTLNRLVAMKTCSERMFGGVRVYEICSDL